MDRTQILDWHVFSTSWRRLDSIAISVHCIWSYQDQLNLAVFAGRLDVYDSLAVDLSGSYDYHQIQMFISTAQLNWQREGKGLWSRTSPPSFAESILFSPLFIKRADRTVIHVYAASQRLNPLQVPANRPLSAVVLSSPDHRFN